MNYVVCRECGADVLPHTKCGCCGVRHLVRGCASPKCCGRARKAQKEAAKLHDRVERLKQA